jgi:hypothetical protein
LPIAPRIGLKPEELSGKTMLMALLCPQDGSIPVAFLLEVDLIGIQASPRNFVIGNESGFIGR